MKNLKTLKAVSAAAIASSIFMAPAFPVFAETMIPEESVVETTNVSKMVLSYDANGGTAAPKAQRAESEAIVTIDAAQPTRNGYVFMGWSENPAADPNGGLLHGGEAYILSHNTTLYAIWASDQVAEVQVAEQTQEEAANEEVKFQVMLDTTGGSMSVHQVDADENDQVVLPDEQPVKPNCTFLGWADSPETHEVVYQPGDTITLTGDMKLYAVWEEPTEHLQVMLSPQGGIINIDHVDADDYGNVTLPDEIPTKDGFTFMGWAENPDTTEVSYQPGDFITLTGDMKLYAVWQQVTPEVHVTLYFDANGGNGGPTSIASNPDGTVTIPTLIPVKSGYKFMGWSTDAKATKAMYGVNQTLTLNSDLKLYAVWQADKVNTGVENNGVMYVVAAGIAAFAAGALFLLRRKEN